MLSELHFLRPEWFWAFVPLIAVFLWLFTLRHKGGQWLALVDEHLLQHLVSAPQQARSSHLPLGLLGFGWVLATVVMAGPSWERDEQQLWKTVDARVVILDISRSMLAEDLTPNRMSRARFKTLDMLKRFTEGDTAMIVFAGDAWVVSPFTSDARTIASMVRDLGPRIAPIQGSRIDLALQKAQMLFAGAQLGRGHIYLVTDSPVTEQTEDQVARLAAKNIRLSILGVGSGKGSPIPDFSGTYIKDASGGIVLSAVDARSLSRLANLGQGKYIDLRADQTDLDYLLVTPASDDAEEQDDATRLAQWQDGGYWLLLLLLPLALFAFRKGWVYGLALCVLLPVERSEAFEWRDLFQTQDQQAATTLQDGRFKAAAEQFTQPNWQGYAHYRGGDYQAAADAFADTEGFAGSYNKANALALAGQLEDALRAYDAALELAPDNADALHNKQVVQQILEQAKQQEQQQDNQQGEQGEQGEEGQESEESQDGQQGESGDSQPQDSDQAQADGEPNESGAQEQSESQQEQENASESKTDSSEAAEASEEQQAQDAAEQAAESGDAAAEEEEMTAAEQAEAAENDEQERQDAERRAAQAEATSAESTRSIEQWLRQIPDEPGGLLKRKFELQQQRQGGIAAVEEGDSW